MKFAKYFVFAAVTAMTACGLSSCSDDDDNEVIGGVLPAVGRPNPSQVFPEGLPKEVDGCTFKTNDEGLVTEISDDDTLVKFSYGKFSRATAAATEFNAKMEIYDTYDGNNDLEYIFYLQLNEQGFITYALEEYADEDDDDIDEWRFDYNNAGQMTYMFRTEGDNEENFLTYADGNIVKNERKENNVLDKTTTIQYTNKTVTTPIVNKGGIMPFDEGFELDMDEMSVAYYAGLLGKPTKNLPVGYTSSYYDEDWQTGETVTYTSYYGLRWVLNAKGLPTALYCDDLDADGNVTWEDSYPTVYKW